MGDTPSPPPAAAAPQAPNYAAANREAVQADIDTLPTRRRIDAAARLGQSVYDPDTGKTYDFTGLGDSALALEQARGNAATADVTAAKMLELQQKYGDQFSEQALRQLDIADPNARPLRLSVGAQLQKDVDAGTHLTGDEENQVNQYIRGSQAARGNTLGQAPAAQEVFAKTEFGEKKKQQALSNASAYIFGSPLTAQYQTLQGAQQGAAPFQPVQAQGIGLNANAGLAGTQFASNIYGTQAGIMASQNSYNSSIFNTQANMPNPWMEGLGMAVSVGSKLGAAAMM